MFTSQSRMNFDADLLLRMGVRRVYATPFQFNNEVLLEPERILKNLERLREIAELSRPKGMEVYPFFVTINHPEGNFVMPERYRVQKNLDGTLRPDFICFHDTVRQQEMMHFATHAAGLGFERLMFDDDLRDAFCYCDEHLQGFEPFAGLERNEIAQILGSVLTHPEHEMLRQQWYDYKLAGMENYARRMEEAIHRVNPNCRIGLCTSAKRCQDFSGRHPWKWARLFSSHEAPVFVRLCGECYHDHLPELCQSTGWHQYMDSVYPVDIERVLEITSVTSVGFRAPSTVLLEARAVLASTGSQPVHWCWTEDFKRSGLDEEICMHRDELISFAQDIPGPANGPFVFYHDLEMGPYVAAHNLNAQDRFRDPVAMYNAAALVGLPVVASSTIPAQTQLVLCAGPVSRAMAATLDAYLLQGGAVLMDAPAAMGYRAYGGAVEFEVKGPISGHRYERMPDGQTCEMIADLHRESVWCLEVARQHQTIMQVDSYSTRDELLGATALVFKTPGGGRLAVLGYDMDLVMMSLIQKAWRDRLLMLTRSMDIDMPCYWDGPVGVQITPYDLSCSKVAVINYLPATVEGTLVWGSGKEIELKLAAQETKRINVDNIASSSCPDNLQMCL